MALMEDLISALGKLPEGTPDDIKGTIKSLFQTVNQEAGKAKSDLETFKKGDTSYKVLTKKLRDAGIEEDRFDSIAEELGVKKTLQDELAIQSESYKQALKKNKELEQQMKMTKMENVLGRKVEEAAKSYKTPDGKQVKISEKFIDKKELFRDIDLDSELLVQDRVSKVVAAAFENQSAFMKEVGMEFQGAPVHRINPSDGNFGNGKVLDSTQIRAVLDNKSYSSKEAAAVALTMHEQAAKQ